MVLIVHPHSHHVSDISYHQAVCLLSKHCWQGTVHDLTTPDGSPSGRVLKAVRSALGSNWLIAMEWEWIVGAPGFCLNARCSCLPGQGPGVDRTSNLELL